MSPPDQPSHEHPRAEHLTERLDGLEAAAIEAELETGLREASEQEAKRHLLWRLVRMSVGALITGAGLALLALPGPGLVVVALGLSILARDVPFARRLLDRVDERIPRDEDGNLPTSAKALLALSVVLAAGATAVSLWWTFFR